MVKEQDRFCNSSPEDVLKTVFRCEKFRSLQEDAISCAMHGESALVLMPTGGGKSICYQLPALCRYGMGLVISPLIALMDDQVAGLRQLGIHAAALHSEISDSDLSDIRNEILSGKTDILYLSPEKLLSPETLRWLSDSSLSVIAIDEAHCISSWGHEFRPDYRLLSVLPDYFPDVPRIALTATADKKTCYDIISILKIKHDKIFQTFFYRENIEIKIINKKVFGNHLIEILSEFKNKAGIIYCKNRNQTERIAKNLKEKNIKALAYHAGLSSLEKKAVLLRFRSGESLVVIATIAFGMGIDRPDVRFIIHLDIPSSPEAYYQQIGRAGRDGEKSSALLFYEKNDINRAYQYLTTTSLSENEKKSTHRRMQFMREFAETSECRTKTLLQYFGEVRKNSCGHCDNCSVLKKIYNKIIYLKNKFTFSSHAQISTSENDIEYAVHHATEHNPIFEKLRLWRLNEAREQEVSVNMIFSDSVLRNIVNQRPRSLSELKQINGMEESRLSRYGEVLIALITSDESH